MSVKEYLLKLTQLVRYGPTMVADNRSRMIKFISCVKDSVVKECRTSILIKEMDLSRLMVHTHQIDEEKHKERERERTRWPEPVVSTFLSQGQSGVIFLSYIKKFQPHLHL